MKIQMQKNNNKFKPKYLVEIYKMKKDGCSETHIAKVLGMTQAGFINWKKRKYSVRYALREGDKDRKAVEGLSIQEYIGNRLSSNVKDTYEKITGWNKERYGYLKAEKILKTRPTEFMQKLFIYTLIANNFNHTKARKKLNIDKRLYDKWLEDVNFVELLNEVEEMIGDFYQEGLFKLIRAGDSPATVFANKTFNRKRGYGEVIEKRLTASLEIKALPLTELNLPAEVLRTVLDAARAYELNKAKALPVASRVIENNEETV